MIRKEKENLKFPLDFMVNRPVYYLNALNIENNSVSLIGLKLMGNKDANYMWIIQKSLLNAGIVKKSEFDYGRFKKFYLTEKGIKVQNEVKALVKVLWEVEKNAKM